MGWCWVVTEEPPRAQGSAPPARVVKQPCVPKAGPGSSLKPGPSMSQYPAWASRLVPLYRHVYSKCISRNPKEFLGRQLRKWLLLRAIILIICWFSYSDLSPNGSQHANGNLQLLLKRLGLSFCAICVSSHPLLVAWRINISRVPIPWIPESCGEKKKYIVLKVG